VSNWTHIFNTRVQLDTRIKYSCPNGHVYHYTCLIGHAYYILVSKWTSVLLHVSNWTRVLNTRVQLDACIKYTCQFVTTVQLDTCLIRHVSNWTRVYSNRYCRHASNCEYFCSDMWVSAFSGSLQNIYHYGVDEFI
jgi:hypothetical protein